MKKLRIYMDTTVWNFPFSSETPEKQGHTLEFFKRLRWGAYQAFASDAVAREIGAAPEPRLTKLTELWAEVNPALLPITDEAEALAAAYLARKALPPRSDADALHVALATIYQMDALVSWNYRHLANLNRRGKLMAVNFEWGYNHPLELVTPLEVLNDEKD